MRRCGFGVLFAATAAGTLLIAPATSFARDEAATRALAPSIQTASSLTLTGVVIDRRGIIIPEAWSVPEGGGSAQLNPPFGQAAYRFPVPSRIPAAGANVTLSVSVTAAPT